MVKLNKKRRKLKTAVQSYRMKMSKTMKYNLKDAATMLVKRWELLDSQSNTITMIRTFQTHVRFISFSLCLILFITSCSQYESYEQQNSNTQIRTNISGEELFKAIYFADGKLSEQISALKDVAKTVNALSETEILQYRNIQTAFFDYCKGKDPLYFSKFKNNILSDDFYIMKNSVTDSGRDLELYLNETYTTNKVEAENYVNNYNSNVEIESEAIPLVVIYAIAWAIAAVRVLLLLWVEVSDSSLVSFGTSSILRLDDNSVNKQQFLIDVYNLNLN